MRTGVWLWWWGGLVFALGVRMIWLATLTLPEELVHEIYSRFRSGGIAAEVHEAWGRPVGAGELAQRDHYVDEESVTWRYVISPGLQRLGEWHREAWPWLVLGWQGLLQSVACAGLIAASWQAFGSRTLALLAGLLTVGNPVWLGALVRVNDVPLMHCLVSNYLAVVLSTASTGGIAGPLLVGVLAGVMFLVRPGVLLAVSLVTIWYLWQMRRVPAGWLASLIVFLAMMNFIVTWSAWHWWKTGEPTPLAEAFWYYHYQGLPPGLTTSARLGEMEWPIVARQVVSSWWQSLGECCQHRLHVWTEVLRGSPIPSERVPAWFAATGFAEWIPALKILLGVAMIFGWRWSYAWYREHRPITWLAVGLPLAYAWGPTDGVSVGLTWAEPIFVMYAALGLLGALPGVGQRLLAGVGRGSARPNEECQADDFASSR